MPSVTSVDAGPDPLLEAARAFADLGRQLGPSSAPGSLQAVAEVAAARVAGARWASVTTRDGGKFVTPASTGEPAVRADAIQYEMGTGPCVDAIVEQTFFNPSDLRSDDRWPELGRRLADEVGMRSMLSFRLAVDGAPMIGGLNIYAEKPDAFDDAAVAVGLLVATHAAAMVALHDNRDRAENLQKALQSNRDIGIAIGILMASHKVTREQAFDLLRIASQHTNRRLRDIALDVADTGTLEVVPPGRRQAPPRPRGRS
jgi:hypothetical protein